MGYSGLAIALVLALLAFPLLGIAKVPDGPGDWLRGLVARWAGNRQLDPALVFGVVMVESAGNPNAKNPADPSTGLMQVTPLIGRAYAGLQGDDEAVLLALMNSEVNMMAGTGFIRHLQDKYIPKGFSVREWIQAYNMGETNFDKGIRNSYGDKVILAMKGWV